MRQGAPQGHGGLEYIIIQDSNIQGHPALRAAMRKLLMLAYGVLKNQQSFDADWLTTRSATAEA